MNKIITISLVLLVILVALTLLLSSFMTNRTRQASIVATPVPTTALPNSGSRQNQKSTFDENTPDNHFAYTNEELAKINLLKDQMPYSSAAFDIDYSSELNQFYVQKKSPDADAQFSDFLAKNGLTEIAKNRGALFNITDDTPANAISKVETQLAEVKKQAEIIEENANSTPDGKSKEEQTFTQSGKTLLSFNFGGPKKTAQPSGKGGGTCATGGYPFPTRGQNLIGRPYQGTHTLGNWESDNAVDLGTPIGTPICAIADGTLHRVKLQNPDPASRFAGFTFHLAIAGNEWWYAHLSSLAPGIAEGSQVKAGQILGYSGAANNVPHLHIAVRNGNPVALLGL